MVILKMTSGLHKGKVRDVSGVDPVKMLLSCVHHGWNWKIDYLRATSEEVLEWGRADMAVRIGRALDRGLLVTFMGKKYRGRESTQELEDAITGSGRMVKVGRDDGRGVVIEAKDPIN